MIIIVDYGMGNVGSILNMLKKIGAKAKVSSAHQDIEEADKLILPGVGAFDTGMRRLQELGLIDILDKKVLDKKAPVLGLCLGMQLLMKRSEEGTLSSLGWIDGEVVRFRFDRSQGDLKIPHMGWNSVTIKDHPTLFKGFEQQPRFYFVHSYHAVCDHDEDIVGQTFYGYEFASVIQRGNIMGTQFHPEKSHRYGMLLLKNFVELA